jgi:hypothetical protein
LRWAVSWKSKSFNCGVGGVEAVKCAWDVEVLNNERLMALLNVCGGSKQWARWGANKWGVIPSITSAGSRQAARNNNPTRKTYKAADLTITSASADGAANLSCTNCTSLRAVVCSKNLDFCDVDE